jgi:hypothetical protein
MTYTILNSSTDSPLLFFMVESADHITALTGASPTVTISKNGGAFGSPSGAVSEIANGWYKVAANATDTNTNGPIALHATAASGDPSDSIVAQVVAYDPTNANSLGLGVLPATATPGAANGLLIAGTNAATTIDALTLTGLAGSGAAAGTPGLTITGGAGGTTGASAAGISVTGGAAGSTSGAASAAILLVGGAAAAGTGAGAEAIKGTGGAASTTAAGGNGMTLIGGVAATGEAGGIGLSITGGAASTTGAGGVGVSITGAAGGTTSAGQHGLSITSGASGTTSANAGNGINVVSGSATAGSGTAGIGINVTGGTATATGTAGVAIKVTGGSGAASANGAASGMTITGGGTNTVSSAADGLTITGTSNGNGMTLTHAGTGKDLNAQTTNALQVNATAINAVSTSSVTTINANIGTTQAITFDSNNYQQVDLVDIAGNAVSTTTAQLGVNTVKYNNQTAQTDANNLPKVDLEDVVGSAVSASTAQLGVNVVNIAGTASAGTAGYMAPDWGHINAPTTTVDLSNTTIKNLDNNPPGTLTAAQIATGVWQDSTAGDFTTSSSIGKSLYTSGNAPGAASGIALVGSNMGTVTSVTNPVTVGTVNSTASNIKKNTALANFEFVMRNSTTHVPQTGLTVTATRNIDNAGFGACANAVSEVANGWYVINFAASDLNGNVIAFRMTATSADDLDFTIVTQP